MKRIATNLVCIGMSFLFAVVPIQANNISDLRDRQQSIQGNIRDTGQLLQDTRIERSRTLRDTEALDMEMTALSEEIHVISMELDTAREILEQTERYLEEAEESREIQFRALKERLRFMYIYGDIGYLEIIFESTSLVDFLNRLDHINRIARADRTKLSNLEETEALIAEKLVERDNRRIEIEILLDQQERRMDQMEENMREKEVLLVYLSRQENYYQQQIRAWEETEREVQRLIREAEEEAAREAARRAAAAREAERRAIEAATAAASRNTFTGGRLSHPLPSGRLTSSYGQRTSPITGRGEFHTGIDWAAPTGTHITAAEAGTVIFSGWQGGFGNTIIIDHGGGMTTLYAHASRLIARVGQQVTRGQVIAHVGSTGFSTGPHLHFEVRQNGRHVNPAPFLR